MPEVLTCSQVREEELLARVPEVPPQAANVSSPRMQTIRHFIKIARVVPVLARTRRSSAKDAIAAAKILALLIRVLLNGEAPEAPTAPYLRVDTRIRLGG